MSELTGEQQNKLTLEQIDNREIAPADTVSLEGNTFSAKVHSYILDTRGLALKILDIEAEKTKELDGFRYKKPNPKGDNCLEGVIEIEEENERIGYYPLAIVEKVYREGHWHREDDALICAVEIDGEWQTRFFPRQNIPKETWEQAVRIINENK